MAVHSDSHHTKNTYCLEGWLCKHTSLTNLNANAPTAPTRSLYLPTSQAPAPHTPPNKTLKLAILQLSPALALTQTHRVREYLPCKPSPCAASAHRRALALTAAHVCPAATLKRGVYNSLSVKSWPVCCMHMHREQGHYCVRVLWVRGVQSWAVKVTSATHTRARH